MADVVRDADTGEFFVRLPGNQLLPISEDQVAAAQEGTIESLTASVGTSVGQAVTGAGALMGVPGAREQFDTLSRQQEARGAVNPVASFAGSIAPDVAIGAMTGGAGPLTRRIGLTAAVEGGLGAARSPDAPFEGAALQGGLGALTVGVGAGVGAVTRRAVRAANEVVQGSRAARATAAAAERRGLGDRVAGLFDRAPDEDFVARAEGAGFRLTPGVRAGSAGMRQLEAGMESKPGGAAAFRELRTHNEDVMKGAVARALGSEGTDLTPVTLGQIKDTIGQAFEDAGEMAGDVALGPTRVQLYEDVSTAADDPITTDPVVAARVGGILDTLPETMSGTDLQRRISKLRREADNEWQSRGGDRSLAEGIDHVADRLEEALRANLPAEVQQALDTARQQWRLLRTLERGQAVNTEGEISVASLDSALRAKYRDEYRYGAGTGNPDIDDMFDKTQLAYKMRDIVGNSGTATRSQSLLGTLTTGPVENLGARAYLGNARMRDVAAGGAAAGLTTYGVGQLLGGE